MAERHLPNGSPCIPLNALLNKTWGHSTTIVFSNVVLKLWSVPLWPVKDVVWWPSWYFLIFCVMLQDPKCGKWIVYLYVASWCFTARSLFFHTSTFQFSFSFMYGQPNVAHTLYFTYRFSRRKICRWRTFGLSQFVDKKENPLNGLHNLNLSCFK